MTTYAAYGTQAALAVKAGIYDIKVSKIEYGIPYVLTDAEQIQFYAIMTPTISRYVGGSPSGGSSVTPVPMRQGDGPSSSTARWGTSLTFSGSTASTISTAPVVSAVGAPGQGAAPGSFSSYDFPYDLIISAGSAIGIFLDISIFVLSHYAIRITIYFEELTSLVLPT